MQGDLRRLRLAAMVRRCSPSLPFSVIFTNVRHGRAYSSSTCICSVAVPRIGRMRIGLAVWIVIVAA
jgi:hypothetical protein